MASFTGLFWVNEHFPLKIALLCTLAGKKMNFIISDKILEEKIKQEGLNPLMELIDKRETAKNLVDSRKN